MHNRAVEIEFDPAKARANLLKHKVSFAHAEQALRDVLAVTIEDPDAVGERRSWRSGGIPPCVRRTIFPVASAAQ
jgi:uncharacterized DUF497 family protein